MANKLMMSQKEECDNYNLITETIDKLVDMCDNAEAIALRDELFDLFTTKYSEPLYNILGLQEELGCPLEVRLKVTHNTSIYDVEGNEYIVSHIDKEVFEVYSIFYMTFRWEHYKKTWWLKKDKSE